MKKKKKTMSNLTRDLWEEVLCRIPLTGLRKVRSTCRKWNTLSKNTFFAKKHLAKAAAKEELMMVVVMDFSVYLMGVNLSDKESSCIKRQSKLIGPEIEVRQVLHCDGLLLCVSRDDAKLVVWNPYCGKPLWIEQGINLGFWYALGYDKRSESHKVLRFRDRKDFTIYDLDNNNNNSDSWRVLDITASWRVNSYQSSVTLDGNAYWLATAAVSGDCCLVCFDFTRETFGPLLPLPFEHSPQDGDTVSLSVVGGGGGKKLAVLFQPWDTLKVEIWVTSKIEPDAVTWESEVFLKVSLKQVIHPQFQFTVTGGSFLIDEERKLAIVFDEEEDDLDIHPARNLAYVIGADGFFKKVDLGESAHEQEPPLACSYLPSLVQPC
ncbi:unnamed protein product [Microthlaspi erraticum]|uniref:F-box domain-containing protein n=1 Tax=Microthlaspi erraticum TaxID=1685480 RepID=A0A6D2IPF5_9BRAS|nr:unnamed protein product [Microthlaspi erraticum]